MKRGLSLGDITGVVDGADCDDRGPFTQVRNKRKKSKKPNTLQNQSKTDHNLIDEVLHSVASQRDSSPASCADQCDIISTRDRAPSRPNENNLASEFELLELKKTVQELTIMVDKLSNQLNFVLSYLDINDINDVAANSSVDTGFSSSVVVTATKNSSIAAVNGATAVATANAEHASTTAAVPATRGVKPRPASLKEAVVTAVHNDQRDRERRARTVIVSGLRQQNTMTDADCFRQLVAHEFSVDPVIKFTKRLGGTVDNRVQRLLVGLQSADQATNLIQRAKQLRRSTDEHVRRFVYINSNLTAVESKLAFEERCRRRRQISQQSHIGRQQNLDDRWMQPQAATAGAPGSVSSCPSFTIVDSYQRGNFQLQNTGGSGVKDASLAINSRSVADNQGEGAQLSATSAHRVPDCPSQPVPVTDATSIPTHASTNHNVAEDARHR